MGSEPTEITKDGTKIWKNENGDRHREDGPAAIYPNGRQHWCINGKLHRENGPAEIYPDGEQHWYINGKRHREDGPATIYPDGTQHWFINGKRHRDDGPATIYPDGRQYCFINGYDITDEIHKWAKDRDIDLDNLTEIDKMIISFEWGNYGKNDET